MSQNDNPSPSETSRITFDESFFSLEKPVAGRTFNKKMQRYTTLKKSDNLPEVLFITSYPPRECGIATYSQDLIQALNNKFSGSLCIKVCALESGMSHYSYPKEVKYVLKTSLASGYHKLAATINEDKQIQIILVQHEFGLYKAQEKAFQQFLQTLTKPVGIVFHTVLPHPDSALKEKIKAMASICESFVVMTRHSADILTKEYGISAQKIHVIAHGTHLVQHTNKQTLKAKYGLQNRKVLTTFGLLSAGKSLETTLNALPAIIRECPEVLFLIIGKTHPEVLRTEGEMYRSQLEQRIVSLSLQNHVKFINSFLALDDLLEYLQLTDIYLFTSNDPNQAVSGTFVYAMSCGCPIISTPIPHAKEVLTKDNGILIDFQSSYQLTKAVIRLVNNEPLRSSISSNTLQKIVSTAWENSAVAHALLFEQMAGDRIHLQYNRPDINLSHLKHMTTNTGLIQFSKINQPDIQSGYTLDDNARALVALCMYVEKTDTTEYFSEMSKYLSFIRLCQKDTGNFYNYVNQDNHFTDQNETTNLEDSNGRAIWALGYVISLKNILPVSIIEEAESILEKALSSLGNIHSPRSMAFAIKGLFFAQSAIPLPEGIALIQVFSNRLVQMYKQESSEDWQWFEGYMTYANSILPEAMLYAYLLSGDIIYKVIAEASFHFLLAQIFTINGIEVISNKQWLQKGQKAIHNGEQPIDVAYTIMTLSRFYETFKKEDYQLKMERAFNWFLGDNRLHQIIYNPCTGGCYDGMEETHVNLNQGAESTVSYLMARLTIEKHPIKNKKINI
jgi:glycosyltransferase involved in cell wall biosynthesis